MATEIVTYAYPVAGAVAPTAAQMFPLSLLTAQVSVVDTSLTVVVTHNMALTAAQLASLFPLVQVIAQTPGTAIVSFGVTLATNTITLTKLSAAGSGGTYIVSVQRPNSAIG